MIAVNTPVWAKRDGKACRAKVVGLPDASTAIVRDRSGREWKQPIVSLTPCVSGPEGQEMLKSQRATIASAHEHLSKARRLARGDE